MRAHAAFTLSCCLLSGVAFADRGALSADIGGGMVTMSMPTPYAASGGAAGGGISLWGGARYGLRNWLEVSASAFYEPPVTAWHNGANVSTPDGEFNGTLAHRASRFGGLVGARYVRGSVWRFTAGLELGFSQRLNSGFQMVNDAVPGGAFDYGLVLPDSSVLNFVAAPVFGLEWAAGDHWSISLLPRVSFLIGASPTVALSIPLVFSWAWYL